jgi:predicted nucleic acid-binding protein
MIVVSDTTPINYLALIGHIGILRELFGHVIKESGPR